MAALYELYDLKTDIRYLQGVEDGILKGEKRGVKKGLEEGVIIGQSSIIEHLLLNNDFSETHMATLLGVPYSLIILVTQRMQKITTDHIY